MGCLMNVLWLIFGGIFTAVEYMIASLLMMITIVGIPFGMQTMKMAGLALWPCLVRMCCSGERSGGCLYILMNVLWIFLGGIWICLSHLGLAYCCVSLLLAFLSVCSISNLPLWRWLLLEKILWRRKHMLSCIGRRPIKEEGGKLKNFPALVPFYLKV